MHPAFCFSPHVGLLGRRLFVQPSLVAAAESPPGTVTLGGSVSGPGVYLLRRRVAIFLPTTNISKPSPASSHTTRPTSQRCKHAPLRWKRPWRRNLQSSWPRREEEKAQAKQAAAKAKEKVAKKEKARAREKAKERIPMCAEDVGAPIISKPSVGPSRPAMSAQHAGNQGMRSTCARARRW